MAERQNPSRRTAERRSTADYSTGSRRSTQERQQQPPSRRNDVIRCERCGEDYSITYKRCPFCDERPGSGGVGGRRSAGGGSRGRVHPIQLIGLIASMVIIIAALFIVFKYVGPLLFGEKESGESSSSVSTSQSTEPSGSASSEVPSGSGDSSGDGSVIPDPVVNVTYLSLDKADITLQANEKFQFNASVSPAEATVVWSSSDPAMLQVNQDGSIVNVNTTGQKVKVTVTATAGDKTAECTVYCNGSGSGGSSTQAPSGGGTTTPPSGGSTASVAPNSRGVVQASSGLNIRSGPGSSYDVIASADNGAEVTILEAVSGWYKIDYGNGKVGYVSADFVTVK